MDIKVRLYGALGKGVSGHDPLNGLTLDLPEGSGVNDLIEHLKIPREKVGIISVDGNLVKDTQVLSDGLPLYGGQAGALGREGHRVHAAAHGQADQFDGFRRLGLPARGTGGQNLNEGETFLLHLVLKLFATAIVSCNVSSVRNLNNLTQDLSCVALKNSRL